MNVLITRPQAQAESLAKTFRQHNIDSICFPAIDIIAPQDLAPLRTIAKQLSEVDALIFVSPNSAKIFSHYVAPMQIEVPVFTIGKGTAITLGNVGIPVVGCPDKANSENLLALPQLQNVVDKKIIIFTGEAGKPLLEDTLVERGASVDMIYTHRRRMPDYTLPLSWQAQSVDICLCTSLVGLHNFRAMLERYKLLLLLTKPLLVITLDMQTVARQLGFKSAIIIATGAADVEIVAALQSAKFK